MAIPTFDQLLRPILELASRENITRRSATAAMMDVFSLTPEEREKRIPSGGATCIGNRTGWAMSHLTKGKLIEKVAKFTCRTTEKGANFLQAHKGPILFQDLKNVEGWQEAWDAASKRNAEQKAKEEAEPEPGANTTPDELIDDAVQSLAQSLRLELLSHLAEIDPYRFEQIVLDVLFGMGYGGSRSEAAQVTRKSNDEGIDGIINEDRFGLDVIYVQAKRWQGNVGRPEIQSFVGALAGQQAHKGVFITTSDFSESAIAFARSVPQKVILINGERLADLMIDHDIGVSTARKILIKKIDADYFEEGS